MVIVLWELIMAEPQGWSAMFVPGGAAARRRPGPPWRCESPRQRSPRRPETGERWSANPIDRTDFLLITPSATPRHCAHVVVSQRRPRARTPARHRVLCLARDPPRPPPPPPPRPSPPPAPPPQPSLGGMAPAMLPRHPHTGATAACCRFRPPDASAPPRPLLSSNRPFVSLRLTAQSQILASGFRPRCR